MKRFFQRLDNSSNQRDYQRQQEGPSSYSSSGSFLGKVFTVGQYQCTVEDVIAEGGFSLVFLVKANNGIRYALKRLYVNNEHDLSICKREIEIARKLGSHKNIIQLVESSVNYCGNEVHEIFILMQYCKGQLLHLMNDRINTGFSETEIIRILCDLCEAVARMHHNDPPIIHRDLKIENILVSDDGNYMLCDFGSATTKILSLDNGQSALSIEEEIKRYTTLAYRSPEMVDVYSGKPITTKADIWALGCLLYKLCYFNLPFGESTLAIQNAQLTIPDSHADRYSQRLSSLIAHMLSSNPDDRPDIYQVSSLTFSLTGTECPVMNRNDSCTLSWSDLRVPPTESQARELKRTVPNDRSSNSTILSAHIYQQQNVNSETENNKTTTVTPRQRPKATININSVLPTSPVAFQRSHTPSNNESIATTSNLSVKDPHNGLTNSHSFSSSSQLFSKVEQINYRGNATDWAKADKQSPTFASNPVLNNDNHNCNSYATAEPLTSSNNNPFITTSSLDETVEVSGPNLTCPPPPPPPPRNQSLTLLENQSSNSNITTPTHQQHRRNMSDSSAFSIKNLDQVSQQAKISTINLSLKIKSQNQSISNEFVDGTGKHQSMRLRSLNPFEDSTDYSYEDQLFGKEFDKIRRENQRPTGAENNPFEAVPFNQDRLKRYLEKQQNSNDHSVTSIVITDNEEINQSSNNHNKDDDDNNNNNNNNTIAINNKKKSTVITIKSNHEYMIVNNSQQKNTSGSTPLCDAMEGDYLSKITSNKSISSSSQGGTATTPTTNYMPLYSSDTAEDDDFDDHGLRRCHDDDDDHDEIVSTNENLRLSHHFEVTGDMTKPLVGDDDDDDDDGDQDGDNKDVGENDDHSSIGSASDLQNSDTDDDDSQDENDSSSDSMDRELNDKSYSDHDHSDNDSEHDDDVIPFKYGLVKNQSSNLDLSKSSIKPLNISRINITSNNSTNQMNNDDGTSVSNSSMRSDSQKNIFSLDHLIGHVEGHRPLLEDDDEDDINPTTKLLIPIDQPALIFDSNVSDSKYHSNVLSKTVPLEMKGNEVTITQPMDKLYKIHSDFVMTSILNHQQVDENEENRRLDEEVERSLIPQVIYDQLNNKDLFGSIPFTNKELINQTMLQKQNTTSVVDVNTNRFENSFADLPVTVIKESKTSPTLIDTKPVRTAISSKSTDLFGAVPFSSSTEHTKMETVSKGNIVKIPQPPQSTIKSNVIKNPVTLSSNTTVTSSILQQVKQLSVQSSVQSKFVPITTTTTNTILSNTISQSNTSSSSLSNTGISKLSRNQLQRSNLKIKSKVAKKYEVDESDDEVDGLLDPLENEDLDSEQLESTIKKKNKKDKKEKQEKKSKESKLKEKKEEKKSKNKEKAEKVEKNKSKDQLKEKKKEKEKKKDKKEKESKEKKDKNLCKTSGDNELQLSMIDNIASDIKSKIEKEKSSLSSSSNKEGKTRKTSNSNVTMKQAFANMSFEDEIQHHHQQKHLSTANNNVTITRC